MTPYSLLFRGKAVLPLEMQILSLKVAVNEKIINERKVNMCLIELETLHEERLATQQTESRIGSESQHI